ncbi:MAG: fumarate reductase iron-sulfur subunit [Planctomycetota bacterium]|jgi:fumarate reductase iron-sulfur subunit
MAQRTLTFEIYRYDPNDKDAVPRMDTFRVKEEPMMSLFTVLMEIREKQDPSLMFDFSCRAAVCGSCGMLVNGRPRLACHTLTKDLPEKIILQPMPVFKHVGDLCVDTGTWFREMYQKVGSWIHTSKEFDRKAEEPRLSNDVMLQVYELERCIECGCCVAACGTANVRDEFVGAVTINRVGRFLIDPRDERSMGDYYEVIGTDQGVFGCIGLMGCEDICPKQIPLQKTLAMVRRKMAVTALKAK